jgi:Domain of unknown function (DUF1905)
MPGVNRFKARVRYFHPDKESGLAVIDIPDAVAQKLGGLKQMRVRGKLNGTAFNSNTMPAGNRVLALSVSKALLGQAGLKVGDIATVEVSPA